jgi:hypothetical protein
MSKIKKPCGTEEEFDRTRLERSIASAGARPDTARRIAQSVGATGDISSELLRNAVAQELMREDPVLSRTYMTSENLVTKIEPGIPQGLARMSEDVLRHLRVASGQPAVLSHQGRVADVRIEAAKSVHPKEIVVSRADATKLQAKEETRVNVRFPW